MEHLIGAIGDLTVDVILSGLLAVPEWGQEAEISGTDMRLGGNVGNMAVGAGALHTDFQVIADIGDDQDGDFILSEVKKSGLDTGYIRRLKQSETSKTYACIRPDGERFMMTSKGTLDLIEDTIMQERIPDCKVLFLGGWCLPPRINMERVQGRLDEWHAQGRILAADLIWSEETWKEKEVLIRFLNNIDIVLLNEMELMTLTGASDRTAAVERLCRILNLQERKDAMAILKLGSAGATMITGTGCCHADAYPCRPLDTVGAGDSFNVAWLHAKFQMLLSDEDALTFAAAFAALVISGRRAYPPTQEEILRVCKGRITEKDNERK